MVKILFPSAGRSDGEGDEHPKRKRKKSLHSSDLWDLPGGATADECYMIVKAKTDAQKQKAEAAIQKKQARRNKKQSRTAALNELGGAIAQLLTAEQHVDRLKVAQLQAILTHRALVIPQGKKADLVSAVKAALQLPVMQDVPPLPNFPGLVMRGDVDAAPAGPSISGAAEIVSSESDDEVESDED